MSNINTTRQTMLFSATLNKDIKDLARANMNEPVQIDLMGLSIIPNRIKQYYTYIDKKKATKFERIPYLQYWIDSLIGFNSTANTNELTSTAQKNNIKMIIFCKTKKCCLMIRVALTQRQRECVEMFELHGDMRQDMRNQAMGQFRKGKNCILIATDLASRGIDVDDIH